MNALRNRRESSGIAVALLATAVGLVGVSGPASAAPPAAVTAGQPVIIVLKDQIQSVPADPAHLGQRRQRTKSAQQAVLDRLAGAAPTSVRSYTAVNGLAATVTAAQARQLAADPAVAAVLEDHTISMAPQQQPAAGSAGLAPSRAATPAPSACPSDPAKPLLEPEALQVTRTASDDPSAATAQQLATGKGVTVAFIADGLDPNLPDFIRPDGSHVIVDYQDFSGEGPNSPASGAEAFGDASAIAAQGRQVYDVANFVNPAYALPKGCTIRVLGMAPDAKVIALKAGGELLPNSAILQAIDYAIGKHVDVINESFGGNITPDNSTRDTIQLFNSAAVAQGISVTVSSGDAGITGTIGSPSTNPAVISVGASTTNRLYAQTGYAASRFGNGTWANNNISALSSGGFTQGGRTMDLVAPGEAGWAVCSTSAQFNGCNGFNAQPSPIQSFGGTSQSAPLTAGAAALVIQAYRDAHAGASPTPARVKQLLTSTSHDLGLPAEEQGAGLLDARAAVEAARTVDRPGTTIPKIASNVLVSPGQLDLTATPGRAVNTTVTVRNVGTTVQTIRPGTRRFAPRGAQRQDVTLDATADPTFPYPVTGAPWAFRKVTFTVPAGTDRLGAAIAWQGAARSIPGGATVTPVVRLSLFDPDGTFQTNTRPQGGAVSANFGFVDVPAPKAGTWTAVLYTVAGAAGYTGTVQLRTTAERAVSAGRVSPAVLRLGPGRSGTVSVRLTAPAEGGDSSESITIASSGGHRTSVPLILRTLVGLTANGGAFAGTITGGNARSFAPAESFTYAFDVPPGRRDLGVGLTLGQDPDVLLEGVLVDPDGEPVNVGTNARFDPDGTRTGTAATLQQTVARPIPGRWRYVLLVQNPVSGTVLSQRFTGVVSVDRVVAQAPGLPASGTRIPAGKPRPVTVTYRNTGIAPVLVQADARRTTRQDVPLTPLIASATVQLPLTPTSTVPAFLVPPGTDQLTLAANSTTPAQVELQAPTGGIDVFGDLRSAQRGDAVSVARVAETGGRSIAQGLWFTFVQQIGPFTTAAPDGTSTLVATAHAQPNDPDVTSSTGDFWLAATDPTADTGTPLLVQPGQTARIAVTITPHGARGTRVDGVLNLITPAQFDLPTFNSSGDVLATLPYRYTVG